jgi:hypothetical protein
MTLSALVDPISYSGDDVTVAFAVTFVYWDDSDVTAILQDANNNETTWVDGTDYNLSGGSGATGTLTAVTAPATNETLVISASRPVTQATALPVGGPLPSAEVEQTFDQVVRMVQQISRDANRSVRAADTTDLSSLIWKQSDGTDWISAFTVNTDTNDVTYTFAAGSVATAALADNAVDGDKIADAERTVGLQTISVPAGAMTARTTTGAASGSVETATNKVMIPSFDFDKDTDEFVQFRVPMPKGWDEGTITAIFGWSHAAATTFDVIWGIQAVALGDSDTQEVAFGTAVTVTDSGGTTDDLFISPTTAAVTIAGTPAEGDEVVFQVYRDADAGADTLDVDARLQWVKILYTIDAASDT